MNVDARDVAAAEDVGQIQRSEISGFRLGEARGPWLRPKIGWESLEFLRRTVADGVKEETVEGVCHEAWVDTADGRYIEHVLAIRCVLPDLVE